MMNCTYHALLLSASLAAPAALFAATPAPTDASAPAPAVTYRSAFEGYQTYREERIADWQAANEEVARAGGHARIMGGAGAHAGHATRKPTEPVTKPAPSAPAQQPERGAPQAPGHDARHR